MRRPGKSWAANAAKEAALNAGLTVVVADAVSITKHRRKGALTVIEHVRFTGEQKK